MIFTRAMAPDDVAEAASIDAASFEPGWTDIMIRNLMRRHGIVGTAVGDDVENWGLMGYAIVRMKVRDAEILRLAVAPESRGIGVGGMLLRKCVHIARMHSLRTIDVAVPDTHLMGHIMLRAYGFRAHAVEGTRYLFRRDTSAPIGTRTEVRSRDKREGKS